MRLIYAENGVQHQLIQTDKNTFKKSELTSNQAAILLSYQSESSESIIDENQPVSEELTSDRTSQNEAYLKAEQAIASEINTETILEDDAEATQDVATEGNSEIDLEATAEADSETDLEATAEADSETEFEATTESDSETELEATAEAEAEPALEATSEGDSEPAQAEQVTQEILALQEIELDQPLVFEEDQIELPVQKYLTSLNIELVGSLLEKTEELSLAFQKDRDQFASMLWNFMDAQISQQNLKLIYTDVFEKKVKDEIKAITKIKVCSDNKKELVKEADELEKNIFSAYNVKNDPFSILGYKQETEEYFGCFHLDSVNFIFIFKQLNEMNKLQNNLFKSFANYFNHLVVEQRSKVKKKRSEAKSKAMNASATSLSTPPITQTIQ